MKQYLQNHANTPAAEDDDIDITL